MYNDIVWEEKRKRRIVYCEFQNYSKLCKKIRARTLVVSWVWIRSGTEPIRASRMENGIESLRTWCSTSVKADNPVFRGSSALERGDLKSIGKGNYFFTSGGDDITVEVVLRTIISVNQLNISGCSERTGELVAQDNPETTVLPTELTAANRSPRTDENMQGNWLHNCERNSSRSSSIDQTMLQGWYQEDRGEGTVFHDPRRCGTG